MMDAAHSALQDAAKLREKVANSHWSPLAAELIAGLTQDRKYINPKFFYDERGSRLFDRITALPEYYPSRTEFKILRRNAGAIADCVGAEPVLIEPGAGSCDKVRCLLESLRPIVYLPQDISAEFLRDTAARLKSEYHWLVVDPLVGDFSEAIELPEGLPERRRVVFYPGSTIGNFEPEVAVQFLREMRELVGPDGGLIIGVDLQKDRRILSAAYNDAEGVTAAFNRNVLNHANRILGTDIDPEAFSHRAFYNSREHRVEMHLVCEKHQTVCCYGTELTFARGESIHTECSYKYTLEGFAALARESGFALRKTWMDEEELFSVHYLD